MTAYAYKDHYALDKTKTFLISQKALIVEGGRVLLLKEASTGKWELPGGLLELEEDLVAGLKREVYEEIGFEIAIGNPISISDLRVSRFVFEDGRVLDTRIVAVTYRCTRTGGSAHLSHEHSDFMWVDSSNWASLYLTTVCSAALKTFFWENRNECT